MYVELFMEQNDYRKCMTWCGCIGTAHYVQVSVCLYTIQYLVGIKKSIAIYVAASIVEWACSIKQLSVLYLTRMSIS